MRILHHAIGGGGLGRLTRLASIAVATQQHAPDVHQLIVTSANYPPLLQRLCMPALVMPADDDEALPGVDRRLYTISAPLAQRILSDAVRAYDPSTVVFDTDAPPPLVEEARRDGRHPVLLLPHCPDELLHDALLSRCSLILLPHAREQIAATVSPGLLRRLDRLPAVRYVNGIVFPAALDAESVWQVAARYDIEETRRLILIYAGWGGHTGLDPSFVARACRAAAARRQVNPAVSVICVAGAHAGRTLAPPGCTVVGDEPDLPLLMARADLVLAGAGYSTVQDIRRAGTRALLVPGSDDQAAFVAALLPCPGMRVLAPGASEAAIGRALHRLMQEPRPPATNPAGAQWAARAILELGGLPDVYICSRAPAASHAAGRQVAPGEFAGSIKEISSAARLCLDWDVADAALDAIAPAAASRILSVEVHLGAGSIDEWEDRVRHVHQLVGAAGLDPRTLSFSLEDSAGEPRLAALAERIAGLAFRTLVVQVPHDRLRARTSGMLAEAERCRALQLGFGIDISLLGNPLPFVDQP